MYIGRWILTISMSHPSRVRGLKFAGHDHPRAPGTVAPFTGAWIEIHHYWAVENLPGVAPFTGAWIEIIQQHH